MDNMKPKCKLIGTDGNVFFLAGKVTHTLKAAGLKQEAAKVIEKLPKCKSYDEALALFAEYVEIK